MKKVEWIRTFLYLKYNGQQFVFVISSNLLQHQQQQLGNVQNSSNRSRNSWSSAILLMSATLCYNPFFTSLISHTTHTSQRSYCYIFNACYTAGTFAQFFYYVIIWSTVDLDLSCPVPIQPSSQPYSTNIMYKSVEPETYTEQVDKLDTIQAGNERKEQKNQC